ncbi:hypothetical protein FEM48_Zijuj02G0097300 [Ziziphus jujuba var. spinosa]|uniref:LysM domain receptor-like kinase 4 n=1 Tax=Ziziphus jujuba var. spinosa TaxID=714518 RepID=A0A978VV11_ZIZJJ|nr:hypothetical protein FEM48_Zijuj02G0097300 [Ziziphus jujuba var. spinosa]
MKKYYIFWFLILVCIKSSSAQQYYDPSDCVSNTNNSGSKYTCSSSSQSSCKTFLVYRASQHFQTISNVSDLFNVKFDVLLQLNNLTNKSEALTSGREILVPITCSCSGQFFKANFRYTVSGITSFSEIACGVFEGLLKLSTFTEENPFGGENNLKTGYKLQVPLKCACPENSTISKGIKYLVTYPIAKGDEINSLSKKFDIPAEELWEMNHLEPWPTVFPGTTFLVPLRNPKVVNFNIPNSPPPSPDFLPTIPVQKPANNTKLKRNIYIAGFAVGFSLLLVALLSCGLFIKALKKWKVEKYQHFTARSSPISCSPARSSPRFQTGGLSPTNSSLSPDLLAGIKFSLFNYSIEEIKKATGDFSWQNKIGNEVYEGLMMDNDKVIIKRMRFEDTRQVIDIHSKINHINIVKLRGVCYGEKDFSWSYLVFEFPGKCLRDSLSDPSDCHLSWDQRSQIAFDIATGLHYLHCYTFPSYAHMRVNTRNIFVTSNCRAKLGNIGATPAVGFSSKENYRNNRSFRGWVAPEYIIHSSVSEKVDIFAFGVVLLELISGKEDSDGKLFKESIRFLGGRASEGGCFEQLKSFMDPNLKEDYSLAEALCLAVLAKACVEDEPLHRPSMDDIIKVLARMV